MKKEDINKTRREVLEDLIKEQTHTVLGRQAGIKVLEKMGKDTVLTSFRDPESLGMKEVKVSERLEEMKKNVKLDEQRLDALREMWEEITNNNKEKNE